MRVTTVQRQTTGFRSVYQANLRRLIGEDRQKVNCDSIGLGFRLCRGVQAWGDGDYPIIQV